MAESYPKGLENTVGKGKIARYEQFLLLPQCFQKACFPRASNCVIVWEWVKLTSANAFNFVLSKILLLGKELRVKIFIDGVFSLSNCVGLKRVTNLWVFTLSTLFVAHHEGSGSLPEMFLM